tara:strand:- start:315 stop:923 length:609 start_codon:yes stop_codon:yes gene_type:complete
MSFGYLGDTSTKIKQQVKNQGVISISEAYELEKAGHFGGSLELIQSQTISSGSTLAFTNIKENIFDVHLAKLKNIESSSASTNINVRFSNDGGSSYEAGTNYQRNAHFGGAISNGDSKSSGTSAISITPDSANQNKNGYCYFYNLGNSSKFSFVSFHAQEHDFYRFGGGVYTTAETINAIQFLTTNSNAWTGTVEIFGLKQL